MAGYRASHNSFAGGVISRQIKARDDTNKYQTALDEAVNMLILPSGGVYIRPGFRYCASLKDSTALARLFPFVFSVNQSYALEFSNGAMRAYYDGGLVLRPELIVTAATQTDPLVVTIPANGYEVGWDVYFSGIEGMTDLNGQTLRITAVDGDDVTFDADATGWGAFTASTGGVAGDSEGGTGGYPPESEEDETPPFEDDLEPPIIQPPKCVWAESYIAPGLMAGDAQPGSPLRKMHPDGSGAFDGAVEAIHCAYAQGYRVRTVSGVRATISDTAPVPVMRSGSVVYVKGQHLIAGLVVAVEDASGFRWEAIESVEFIGLIRVAKISTGDGIYGAGDVMGRMLFTHNLKSIEA